MIVDHIFFGDPKYAMITSILLGEQEAIQDHYFQI